MVRNPVNNADMKLSANYFLIEIVDALMACHRIINGRNLRERPALIYPSSGNMDEIGLARAMGFKLGIW